MEKLKQYQKIIKEMLAEFAEECAGDQIIADDHSYHYQLLRVGEDM